MWTQESHIIIMTVKANLYTIPNKKGLIFSFYSNGHKYPALITIGNELPR